MEFQELPQTSEISPPDVIRSSLCETPAPLGTVTFVKKHLCESCVEKHLSEESKEHTIEEWRSTLKCSIHSTEICTRYCERCKIHFCALCVSLGQHKHQKTMNQQATEECKENCCVVFAVLLLFVIVFILCICGIGFLYLSHKI